MCFVFKPGWFFWVEFFHNNPGCKAKACNCCFHYLLSLYMYMQYIDIDEKIIEKD